MPTQKFFQPPNFSSLIVMLALILSAGVAHAQTVWEWDASPGLSADFTSPNAVVYAMQQFDDGSGTVLFAGGSFVMADLEDGTNIARWNGTEWLPAGEGLNGDVHHLHQHDGGLFAGGDFTMSGDQEVNRVARWNGDGWVPVGSGFDGMVRTMETFNGELIAGGWFTASGETQLNYLARWDGDDWQPVENELSLFVETLLLDDTTDDPMLYVGGWFTMNGDQQLSYIGSWDGESWSPLGDGFDNFVQALALFDDGSGPVLYASGYFNESGGDPMQGLAKWDQENEAWSIVDEQNRISTIESLYVFDDGFGEALYVGGQFRIDDGLHTASIARWDGSLLSQMRTGLSGAQNHIFSIQSYHSPNEDSPALYAGGFISQADGAYTRGLAKWKEVAAGVTESSWDPQFGRIGSDQFIRAMHLHTDADGNQLLVTSGDMNTIGGSKPGSTFAYDGENWLLLGERNIRARHFFTFDAGSGPELYAVYPGGSNFLVRWDGSEWVKFGATPFHTINDHVVVEENGVETLYAVGTSGTGQYVLKFDGSDWEIIAQGMGSPRAITWHDGILYVGGGFSEIESVDIGAGVARWNSETGNWSGMDGGTECSTADDPGCSGTVGQVRSLNVHNGYLIMAGGFSYAGGEHIPRIARYNLEEAGATWEPMSGGQFNGSSPIQYFINATATVETEEGSQLYAGGTFWLEEEGVPVNIVRWNGAEWEPLEEGARRLAPNQDGYVNHIIPKTENGRTEVFVGGYFHSAGLFPSNNIARWFPDERPPEVPVSVAPEHRSQNNPATVSFSWFSADSTPLYEIQVATDPGFNNITFSADQLTESTIDEVELVDNLIYYWRVRASRDGYVSSWSEPAFFTTGTVTSAEAVTESPMEFRLDQNYPNPFNPTTNISYQLPAASDVRLEVFDIIGRRVALLIDGPVQSGRHTVQFNASHLASGVYLYRLTTPGEVRIRKMTLIK